MGVITAAWAGLLAALFSSSDYNIVGPTGALSGLLANYAQMYPEENNVKTEGKEMGIERGGAGE